MQALSVTTLQALDGHWAFRQKGTVHPGCWAAAGVCRQIDVATPGRRNRPGFWVTSGAFQLDPAVPHVLLGWPEGCLPTSRGTLLVHSGVCEGGASRGSWVQGSTEGKADSSAPVSGHGEKAAC